MFRFLFCSHDMCKFLERRVLFIFILVMHHASMRQSQFIYRMLFALHLYLLSMALQNALCASLISFEVWMPISLHIENRYLQNALLLHLYLLEHDLLQKELNSHASLISIQRVNRNWSIAWLVIKSYIKLKDH